MLSVLDVHTLKVSLAACKAVTNAVFILLMSEAKQLVIKIKVNKKILKVLIHRVFLITTRWTTKKKKTLK